MRISPAWRRRYCCSAWRVPRLPPSKPEREQSGWEPNGLPVGEAFVANDVDRRRGQRRRNRALGRRGLQMPFPPRQKRSLDRAPSLDDEQERCCRTGERREGKIPVAGIEHETQRRLHREDGKGNQQNAQGKRHRIAWTLRCTTENLREGGCGAPRRQGGSTDHRRRP